MTDKRDEPMHLRNAKALAEALRAQTQEIAEIKQKNESLEAQIALLMNRVTKLEQEQIMNMVKAQGSGPTSI